MAAEQAKDRGNRAFTAGNYADAVASFSEAIALHAKAVEGGTTDADAGKPHVYYSNRSAAYLKQGDGTKALEDADKCISLKRDWVKGYSRKGSALYHLGRYADAYRAYKEGLALETTNAALLDGLRSVEQKMSAPASSGSASRSYPTASSSGRAPATSVKTAREFLLGDKAAKFQLFQFVMRSLLLTTFLLYWIPVVVPPYIAFATFFKVALFNHASYLAFTHGLPKWQAAYAQRLVLDPSTQALFFCLVFWVSAPFSLALVPVFLIEMVHFCAYLTNLLQVLKLGESPLVALVTSKAVVPLTGKIISDPSFATLPTQSKWAKLYHRMPQVAANIEVGIGMALLVEILTPARNFLLTVLYWQLLRVRYMINPQLQEAFRLLNASIMTLVHHPKCPTAVGTVYAKIQAFATSMADVQQQQAAAAGGGLASKCTVM
ncbi:Transmembrane protein, partial [Globisporangium splendens]